MKIFGRSTHRLRVQSLPVNDRSYISATTGDLRGIPRVEPVLRLTFNVEAGGLADGASALFLATANVESSPGRILSLGTAAPVLKLLGFPERDDGDVYKTPVYAEWKLTDTAIELIEKLRDGGDLTIYPNLEYALISPGIALPDWRQCERPIRATWPRQPTNIRIDSHQWATNVLEPWQLAAAVSLVVALLSAATDEQRAIVARLATARQRLTAGSPDDLKASISASREAVEPLRGMRPATVNSSAQRRDLAEREAVILDKMKDLAQAVLDLVATSGWQWQFKIGTTEQPLQTAASVFARAAEAETAELRAWPVPGYSRSSGSGRNPRSASTSTSASCRDSKESTCSAPPSRRSGAG
jgi:hypothetical protein